MEALIFGNLMMLASGSFTKSPNSAKASFVFDRLLENPKN